MRFLIDWLKAYAHSGTNCAHSIRLFHEVEKNERSLRRALAVETHSESISIMAMAWISTRKTLNTGSLSLFGHEWQERD